MAADAASATVKVAHRISNINSSSSRSNSSISRGTSEGSPRSSSLAVSAATAACTVLRGMVCFRCGQPGHFLSECRAVPPTPNTRLPDPYAGAQVATYSCSGDYANFGSGAPLPSQSAPAPPDRMNRLFRPSRPGALPSTGPPWRNVCHQASRLY